MKKTSRAMRSRVNRRRAPARRGRMIRSDQSRYHQEWVGFSKVIAMPATSGAITTFDAGDSAGFTTRFQDWRAYRILGWTCSVLPAVGYDANAGITAFAPFNQSNFGAGTFPAPNRLQSLLELPNCRTLPISDSNPRSKSNFQWFNRRGDINALPFQQISLDTAPEYLTGLLSFNTTGGNIIYQVYGKFLVQFKDKNFFNAPATEDIQCEYPESPVAPVVKRLDRGLKLH
jgi:hypothetical protein